MTAVQIRPAMTISQPGLPRVVEIVGPAGAGKSTLCQALASASEAIQVARFPDVRSIADAPFFAQHVLRTAFRFGFLSTQGSRRLSRREFAWLSILDGWPKVLKQELRNDQGVTLLDQGPVYLLTEIRETGPEHLRNQASDPTWQGLYANWARTLDAVVYLDAPDTVLAGRIRGREKGHIVKEAESSAVIRFLEQFRASYNCTLAMLTAHNPALRILPFDTSRETTDDVVHSLLPLLGLAA